MFGMVQFHDLPRDDGLERAIVVAVDSVGLMAGVDGETHARSGSVNLLRATTFDSLAPDRKKRVADIKTASSVSGEEAWPE